MAVFYRKYRPQKLADLIGQDHVREALLSSLVSGKISHGYLFSGPRGSGKTSTARIFAKAVNCEVYGGKKRDSQKYGEPCNKCNACRATGDGSYLDLIEIDAASNRGIDEIRDLRDKIKLSPVSGRFKVYIIDEVHMLTPEAFNALLKTLEEPPAHAIFILCTTLPEKLPATIISRLTRFNFKKATAGDLSRVTLKIAKLENIKIEKEAIGAIAKAADGSYRDALSILDQLASAKKTISEKDVKAAYKLTSAKALYEFLEAVFGKDLRASVLKVEEIGTTHDIQTFILDAILLLKKLLFIKIGAGVQTGKGGQDETQELAQKATYSEIQNLMKLLLVAESETHLFPLPEISLTLAVCKFLPEVEEGMGPVAGSSRIPASAVSTNSNRNQIRSSDLRALDGTPSARATHNESEALETSLHVESPRAPKKETVKVSKASAKSMADLEAKWGEFLAKVRPVNAHVVALLKSTRPSAFDGVNLVLEVFFKFHKEKLEEPKIMNLLCEVLEEVLGKPVSLKFVLANRESRPTKTVTVSDVAEIGDDELSKMAAEIFSK
ncbi:MAG: DNA polymerase III subunit gamma/tau [Candidatus Curtissbacteria bacterium]|nr:DNA polymerase III subunit gamma/tau [Candidatus Curtissbacteria bacterium]